MGNDARDCSYISFVSSSCAIGQDGEINTGAMNRQATAKSILAIGASENNRGGTGIGLFDRSCTSLWGYTGPWWGNPVGNSPIADNPEGMWCKSNTGPTNDGRVKPDIVAPGTHIVSTMTGQWTVECGKRGTDCVDSTDSYSVKSGTSMATPVTAGVIALLIEHLNDHGYDCDLANNPSSNNCPDSALIKAILSASAHDMEGQYTYGGDGQNGAVEKAPNHHEGWGRLDITRAVGSGFSEGIDIITDDSHSFKASPIPA